MTRRQAIGGLAAAALSRAETKSWKPKLGYLTPWSEANLEFARQEGFTCLSLEANALFEKPEEAEKVRLALWRAGIVATSLMSVVNHTASDPAERKRANETFLRAMTQAATLGVTYVATLSGNMTGRRLKEQVNEIVRVYHEQYFPVCQKHNLRIVWEPWPEGPNVATGPVGYEALFKAFSDVPYVGIQYDPSHLVRQFMDPIQCARDFADKIWDVHLKDVEIFWPVLRKAGIHPIDGSRWWRYRLPGFGSVGWREFFTVLREAGYQGGMNIEHEDELYGFRPGNPIRDAAKTGLRLCHEFLKQHVPAS